MGKEAEMDEHGDLNEKKHVDKENLAKNMWNLTEKNICSTQKTWDIMEMVGGDLSIKDGDLSIKW